MKQLEMDDYFRILRRKWWLILTLAIVGAGLGFAATYVLPKKFTSQTLVLIQQPSVPGDYVKPVISQDVNQRLTTMQQQILSRSRLEPVVRQFGLYSGDVKSVPMEDLVDRLRKVISITPIRGNAGGGQPQQLQGFSISVAFDDPHLAQQICSTITSMFMEENLKLRQELSEQTTDFLSKQLNDAKAALDQQDAKLAAFQRSHIGSLPDEDHGNLGILGGLTTQLDAATQALARAQQDKAFAESVLAQQLEAGQASSQLGQNPDSLQKQLDALELQLSSLESKYTEDHPDVIKAKNDIEVLKKKIADAQDTDKPVEIDKPQKTLESPQIQNLRTQIYQLDQLIKEKTAQQDELQKQIKTYQARVESSPAIQQEYKELTRDYDTALRFYNELLGKRDQSAMATDLERRQQGEQFQVLDPANLPDAPSFPNVPLFIAGGGVVGLSLGFGLVFLFEILDSSLRSRTDVETILHVPVLAMIPAIEIVQSANRTRLVDRFRRPNLEKVG